MNLLQRLFGRKRKEENKPSQTIGNVSNYRSGTQSQTSTGNSERYTDQSNDILNPLNPISPLWIGNSDNSIHSHSSPSYDFGSSDSSHDHGSSFDSGSSHHSYDPGGCSSFDSSSSSSFDSSSSSSTDW